MEDVEFVGEQPVSFLALKIGLLDFFPTKKNTYFPQYLF